MKIAIIKLSSLGDVIHALPVAHALRRSFPSSHLTWFVEARVRPVLNDHPDLDEVVAVDTKKWRQLIWTVSGAREVWESLGALRLRLRDIRFDVAIDLQGLVKSGLLTAFTAAPLRIGFTLARCREPLNVLFTNRRVRPPGEAVHVVEEYLSLLTPLGVEDGRPVFHLPQSSVAEHAIDAFLAEQGLKPKDRLVALNPGAGRPQKCWPLTHFRRLAERLATEAGCRVLVLWGPAEMGLASVLGEGMMPRPVLAPPTGLAELTALFRRCSLVVAADTGPLHLAAALGTPALGLYGPTRVRRNGPYGQRCRTLQSPDGSMATLAPDQAFSAAVELLDGTGSDSSSPTPAIGSGLVGEAG
ncbi:MAG: lipopolysaccharide heptosyltransferase I [Candidatus Methylomirabilia bacterium]